MIRYLIWDVDGTLFDTYPAMTRAFGAALEDFGAAGDPDRIAGLLHQSYATCLQAMTEAAGLDPDLVSARYADHYRRIGPEEQPPFPDVDLVLAYVAGLPGGNFIVTHRDYHGLQRLLSTHGLAHLFRDAVTLDDGYPRKPDPAAFDVVIERHGLPRTEILAVGDRRIDVLGARQAGVRTCLYGPPDPDAGQPDYQVTSYRELHRLLQAENGDSTA